MKKVLLFLLVIASMRLWSDLDFGKGLFNDGLYDEAIIEFNKKIAGSPTSDEAKEALFYIAESYREQEQYSKAETYYRRLLEGFPGLLFRDKVLYYLALTQYEQLNYTEAEKNLQSLITTYPSSSFSKKALSLYLDCLFSQQKYDSVIREGNNFVSNYEDYHNIPNVFLWIAKANLKKQKLIESKRVLDEIIKSYPSHITRWKALGLLISIEVAEKGIASAAELLSSSLTGDLPRDIEEQFRYQLANYYIEMNEQDKAFFELSSLINKFSSSLSLDEYIIKLASVQLKLNKFEELLADYSKYKKVFSKSSKKDVYLLKLAHAEFAMKNLEASKEWLNQIKQNEGQIFFSKQLLEANILHRSGKYTLAVEEYTKLLNNKYATNSELLMTLGDIFLEKYQQYNIARKYYQRITAEYSTKDLKDEASYKIALCYEKLNSFNEALRELEQVDLDNVVNQDLKERISTKKLYLKKFKIVDYESAFKTLITTLIAKSDQNNTQELKTDLIDIIITDLKDYKTAINILEGSKHAEDNYKMALSWLLLAEQYQYESQEGLVSAALSEASRCATLFGEKHTDWLEEISIRIEMILKSELDSDLLVRMENFVEHKSKNKTANEFKLYLGEYYLSIDKIEKANEYFADLVYDDYLAERSFFNAKIHLAEFHYNRNEDSKALEYYKISDDYIKINRPLIYFHYCVVLNELGQKSSAKEKLEFLVNNAENFDGYSEVIQYFTKSLRESKDYEEAVKYQLLIPFLERDDSFYKLLAEDYIKIGNDEKAIEALMHINDKNEEELAKLAYLQLAVSDLGMAKYSFEQLINKNSSKLEYYEVLGRIYFLQEDYLEAAKKYKIIVDKLGDNFAGYSNIRQVLRENIISLLRIENRPKAETLEKRYKQILTESDKYEIELNRGIYYKKIDLKKAESIFTKLLKKKDLTSDVVIKAYFWRGLVRLEQEELDDAELDFLTVANSIDLEMSNQANLKLGTINFSKEKYQEALVYYYKVIENDQDGKLAFDAARNFAFVCKTIKEWQKAIAAYQIILERWGDEGLEAKTVFDIAFCHYRDKKYTHAIEMFNRAIPILEDKEIQAEAQYWIGESYFGKEDYITAVTELLKVGYNYPQFTQWAASAELKAGESYQNMNQYEKAIQIYDRVISKYGKYSQWGTEADNRLKTLK
ncbi:MAG: tetratricopeptide repeat protein [Candidatus Cloacimonetes bacterium]|nr:tetratricopeptide repeat protein [Candidatus Cloacimonadota bacterium]